MNECSVRAFSAMRRSFVATDSPLLRTVDVSLPRATMCGLLPSSGITRLRRYYEAIRLPTPHLPFSFFSCPAYFPIMEESTGPPGFPHNPNVTHAKVSDPEEASAFLPLTLTPVLTSTNNTVSSFLSALLTRLNPFNLSAFGLSARCPTLKADCYQAASKDSLPGGRPAFRGGIHTRWIMRPCPAARYLEI